jgi:hypothetical protein
MSLIIYLRAFCPPPKKIYDANHNGLPPTEKKSWVRHLAQMSHPGSSSVFFSPRPSRVNFRTLPLGTLEMIGQEFINLGIYIYDTNKSFAC